MPSRHIARAAAEAPAEQVRCSGGMALVPPCCRSLPRPVRPEPSAVSQDEDEIRYEHLLVAIVDANPYLSGGSKQVSWIQVQL